MIKKIVRMGNPLLAGQAKPVEAFSTPELYQLIQDLFDTMKSNGGVGIAAPQIGVALQVVVFGFDHSTRYPHATSIPETVLINPRFVPVSDEHYPDWEGCLSMRGLRGLAHRFKQIHYEGYDQHGNFFEREVSGFHARVVQHEIDHLNGKLLVNRVNDLSYFGFEDEMQTLMQQTGDKLA
ncbi:MAG: peptide deformylase [Gammaproteobacteria bacterium]|nr:peptide deformylase [Gammaproteobacteria bacterium]